MAAKRRRRHCFRDHTGKRVRVYADTLQRHAHLPPLSANNTPETDHNTPNTDDPMPRKIKEPTLLLVKTHTSGTSEKKHRILEIAVALVDCRDMDTIIDHHCSVVKHDPGTLDDAPAFHAALVQECYQSEAATRLPGKEGFLLAGQWSSAHAVLDLDCGFTLKFLEAQMPLFYKALPKCRVDMDAVRLLLGSRGVPAYVTPDEGRSYRAMDDIVLALDELQHWLSTPAVAR